MKAKSRKRDSVALQIATVLDEKGLRGRISVIVEGMPIGAMLSAGTNNWDRTWSLAPDELADLRFVPPEGATGNKHVLTVRVLRLDDEGFDVASTVALFDLTVGATAAVGKATPAKGARRARPADGKADGTVAAQRRLKEARTEQDKAAAARLAEAKAEWDKAAAARLAEAKTAWRRDEERTLAAEKAAWKKEVVERLAAAKAAWARLAETRLSSAEADWQAELERKLSEAKAHLRAEEKRQLTEQQAAFEREVQDRLKSAEARWTEEETTRLAVAREAWDAEAKAPSRDRAAKRTTPRAAAATAPAPPPVELGAPAEAPLDEWQVEAIARRAAADAKLDLETAKTEKDNRRHRAKVEVWRKTEERHRRATTQAKRTIGSRSGHRPAVLLLVSAILAAAVIALLVHNGSVPRTILDRFTAATGE